MLMVAAPEGLDATYDLREASFFSLIHDAVMTMLAPRDRLLRVIGPSPKDPAILVEVVMDEAPLRHAMFDYSWRILNLSLGISIFTAALVYLSLHLLMVRPMRRIPASMAAFRPTPDYAADTLPDSQRSAAIATATRALAPLQQRPPHATST